MYGLDRLVSDIRFLAIARVGKGPYVLHPTRKAIACFNKWRKDYREEVVRIQEEDICFNV